MKYQKKSKVINAIQLNFLNDADRIINDCPWVVGANDIWAFTGEPTDQWYVRFEGIDKDYQMYFTDWLVWNDNKARIMTNKKFKEKYIPATPTGFITTSITSTPQPLDRAVSNLVEYLRKPE